MVLEILSPATFNVLSPQTRATQEGLKSELDTMTVGRCSVQDMVTYTAITVAISPFVWMHSAP